MEPLIENLHLNCSVQFHLQSWSPLVKIWVLIFPSSKSLWNPNKSHYDHCNPTYPAEKAPVSEEYGFKEGSFAISTRPLLTPSFLGQVVVTIDGLASGYQGQIPNYQFTMKHYKWILLNSIRSPYLHNGIEGTCIKLQFWIPPKYFQIRETRKKTGSFYPKKRPEMANFVGFWESLTLGIHVLTLPTGAFVCPKDTMKPRLLNHSPTALTRPLGF